ncbi:MAG TPA: hypothetical protein PLY40_09435 [Bacillota bacterium]|nr:hypothetical protein [Bacillota bacterium]
MKRKDKNSIVSCFQCIAVKTCYGCDRPELSKEEARHSTSVCTSLRKGLSSEKIEVIGAERGVSRKNAEKLVNSGKALWVAPRTIRLIEGDLGEAKQAVRQAERAKP